MVNKSFLVASIAGFMMGAMAQSANVLMYGQMTADNDGKYLTEDQFETHLDIFKSGKYSLVGLDDLMSDLKTDAQTTISFSEGYKDAYELGMLSLLNEKIPFALFITPSRIGQKGFMTWEQVISLHHAGVTLGVNPNVKQNLTVVSADAVQKNLLDTMVYFENKMGFKPKYVTYPFGSVSKTVMDIAKQVGFSAAFGQYSGGFNQNSNMFNLPRFSLSRKYGSESRLKQLLASGAMPITAFLPVDPTLTVENNPPSLGFTFDFPIKHKGNLSCYHSQLGKVNNIKWLGNRRVEVRFEEAFKQGSSRLNCTMPAKEAKRWYWLGQQFYVPKTEN